jgi:hypothetical protein
VVPWRADKAFMPAHGLRAPGGPHIWRLKRTCLRSRLMSNGWGLRRSYAEKVINGRRVMVQVIREDADWVLCCFERRAS